MKLTKRLFDITLAIFIGLFAFLPGVIIAIIIKMTSKGPAIHWSRRVGRDNKIFLMPKFRTMRTDTPDVATHLLENPDQYITAIGKFLRKTSLDELPQVISILTGNMSFVGPRPALFNQDDLVSLRTEKGVHLLVPGVTGWAQINGRDSISIPEKVKLDEEYKNKQGIFFDIKIIFLTFFKVFFDKDVSH